MLTLFPLINKAPMRKMMLVLLLGCLMVPVALDVRGWHEIYPLNGPGWSLFFEYVANVLYTKVMHRFSNGSLGILMVLAAGALLHLGLTSL